MSKEEIVEAIRRFNRFYTQQIGVLHEKLLSSPFSLTEARVIYELGHQQKTTATDLAKNLGLDAGYLSRILKNFSKHSLIAKESSKEDGRQTFLWLITRGKDAFATLNASSQKQIQEMLGKLSANDQRRLIGAMNSIENLLGEKPESKVSFILRPHQPGDIGWIVHRHGVLYSQEYGWDEHFEALVGKILTRFIEKYDRKKERCWIAEMDGEIVGCVFLVKRSKTIGQLRCLLVEPKARSLGLGTRLVDECIRFAKQVGYKKMMLWTNDVLHAARHIYEKFGFRLVREEKHHSFGKDLVGQNWEMRL